ncbi:helix-turn-helix domain-containing protein [[Kitasatospora] papulosa]|uniref:helix-turn-helix domain-containing protein n=2 Tax=Streptomyces TaxID=1883 RepID=UPI0025B3D31B|nr:helix-turn-helix transcriptional regulator [Streptomyces sp. P9-2B-1]WJY35434.1 helix-turn-helix transcriptional regulator [Streptomyces sp. P9-2B-1]
MSAVPQHVRATSIQNYLAKRGGSGLAKKLIARTLEGLRTDAGLSQGSAAKLVGFSNSKLCRIEKADTLPKAVDLEKVLSLYGAGDELTYSMLQLLDRTSSRGWWQSFSGAYMPEHLERLIALQEEAELIRCYEMQRVPGLMQTERYAHAVIKNGLPLAGRREIATRTRLKMERQNLLGRPGAPTLWAMIDESVLHRTLGGQEVMREQIQHLLNLTDLTATGHTHISLQVVPMSAPVSVSAMGGFTHLRFDLPELPDVVYVEDQRKAEFYEAPAADRVDDEDPTDVYRALLDQMAAAALTPSETRELLRETLTAQC